MFTANNSTVRAYSILLRPLSCGTLVSQQSSLKCLPKNVASKLITKPFLAPTSTRLFAEQVHQQFSVLQSEQFSDSIINNNNNFAYSNIARSIKTRLYSTNIESSSSSLSSSNVQKHHHHQQKHYDNNNNDNDKNSNETAAAEEVVETIETALYADEYNKSAVLITKKNPADHDNDGDVITTSPHKVDASDANNATNFSKRPKLYRQGSYKRTDSGGSSSSSSNSSNRNKAKARVWWRRAAATASAAGGFVAQSFSSLWTDYDQVTRSWFPLLRSVLSFLRDSGLQDEMLQTLGQRQLFGNLILLYRIQSMEMLDERRRLVQSQNSDVIMNHIPSFDEAYKYMRYATAIYGNSMMRAASWDQGKAANETRDALEELWDKASQAELGINDISKTVGRAVSTAPLIKKWNIAEYVDLPEDDIVHVDDGPQAASGDGLHHLKHFIAVDHERGSIILSIRGTFTMADVLVDVAAFTRK